MAVLSPCAHSFAALVNQDLLLIDGADLIEAHSTIGIETRGVENIVLNVENIVSTSTTTFSMSRT